MTKKLRFADVFCGIGGARVGIDACLRRHDIPHDCVFSCDIKKTALQAYNTFFGEAHVPLDIRTVDDFPDMDMLLAGFPCQPFSTAGKRDGMRDPRGNLYLDIARIVRLKRPRWVILENVPNLEIHDRGRTFAIIRESLESLGYCVTWSCFDARDFGLAQRRNRIFIVATLGEVFGSNEAFRKAVMDEGRAPPAVLGDVLDTTLLDTDIRGDFLAMLRSSYPDLRTLGGKSIKDRRGGASNVHSWDIGYHGAVDVVDMHILNTLVTERRKKKHAISRGTPEKDGVALTVSALEALLGMEDLEPRLEALSERGYLVRREGRAYDIAKGKLSFPVSKVLHPGEPCPTLTATDSGKLAVAVSQSVLRRLSPGELAALSGFPDTFKVEKASHAFDLFGNCICPPVVRAIGEALIPDIKKSFAHDTYE